MAQPLLTRDPETQLLSVNFDDKLVAVLKEMKYLKLRNKELIPVIPEGVFEKRDMLFKYYANLMLIMQLYNKLITDSLPVEKPLIAPHLLKIDQHVEQALTTLAWEMQDIWEYIADSLTQVQDLTSKVQQTKDNVEKLKTIMATWSQNPLFERKEKLDNLLGLTDRQEAIKKRYNEITAAGIEVLDLMETNRGLFDADVMSEDWLKYVDYLDAMV
ncbi:unnamed protein product, partial [Lymnaea stagnalis]